MKTRQSGMFLVEENTFCVIKHTHKLTKHLSFSLLQHEEGLLPFCSSITMPPKARTEL